MIATIRGPVLDIHDSIAIIEAGGVGYAVTMPTTDLRDMPLDGTPVMIHTHLQVREDGMYLYGFLKPRDLEIFRALTTVTRIGPTLAVSILSQITADELVRAITGEQEQVLVSLSGIGKRNARRLIVELKESFEKLQWKDTPHTGAPGRRDTEQDAVSALIALGFDAREAFEAVSAVSDKKSALSAPALVREALAAIRRGPG